MWNIACFSKGTPIAPPPSLHPLCPNVFVVTSLGPRGMSVLYDLKIAPSHLLPDTLLQRSEAHSGASSRNVKMATDLGELLVPYMPTIRVPRTGDRVFKSECAFSYDSPVSIIMSNISCMNVKQHLASPDTWKAAYSAWEMGDPRPIFSCSTYVTAFRNK